METKICMHCKRALPLGMFNEHGRAKDGLRSYCRDCQPIKTGKNRGVTPNLNKIERDPSNPLSGFTPRELMRELARRGYEGELTVTNKIDINRL